MSSVDPRGGAPAGPLRPLVLVVDDDPLVGRAVGRLLRGQFEVELAGGVGQAIARVQAAPPIDLVLSDLRMPGRDGLDLWRWLSEHEARLARRLVVMSGDVGELPRVVEETGAAVLRKPFDLATLVDTVRGRLAID